MHSAVETGGMSLHCAAIRMQRKKLLESLAAEQRKLETMILELFVKGKANLGEDQRILEQSSKLDQIVVDEMMLEEMLKKLE
jgi:hypothetical protein